PGATMAADYYVDIYNGDDANTGTAPGVGGAWKTLHYAAETGLFETYGNTLHVAAGYYTPSSEVSDTQLSFFIWDSAIVGDPAGGTIIDLSGGTGWSHGLQLSPGCQNVTLSDLVVTNATGSGIFINNVDSGVPSSAITVTHCTLYQNTTGILLVDCDATNTVSANTIYDNTTGILIGSAESSNPVGSPVVVNNLIYNGAGNSMSTGIRLSPEYGDFEPQVYHNTINGAADYGIDIADNASYGGAVAPDIRYNNITGCGIGIADTGAYPGSPAIEYNNLYGNTTPYSGVTPGTSNIAVDPQYADAVNYDFHLVGASECVDAADFSTISTDLEGTPRPQGADADIGCYEYSAAVGGNYYVDINTGTDATGYGLSPATPWRTLHYALMQSFVPGDVLHVAAGEYSVNNGETEGPLSVMEAQGLTIVGDPAGDTVIDATSPMYYWSYGLDISNSTGITIADLEIINSFNSGIYVNGGSNINVTRCDVHNNASSGIYLYDCDASVTVSANKIYDNPTGIYIHGYLAGSPTVVNNLIYSTDGSLDRGINFYVEAFSGIFSPTIYHNTIDSAYIAGIEAYDSYNNTAALTPRIQYNIVTNSGTGILDSSTPAEGLIVDYNCLFGNTTNYGNVTGGDNDITVNSDPLYNDPADPYYDFHLTAGSPCVDAAVTSSISTDLDGTDRTAQGTYPDIGCYEHLLMPPSDNLPPAEPTCPSPATFAVFAPGQPVTLQGGPYSDPENDTHRASHWLVNRFDLGPQNWMIDYETQSPGELTSYTISGTSFAPGLAYHWAVGYQDSGSYKFSFPATDKNAVPPQRVFVVGVVEDGSLPPAEPGTTAEDYRMVSVSHIPTNPSAVAVLGDDMAAGYDPTQYRIGVYDCEYNGGGYREYPDFAVLPGGAAWVLARNGFEPDITGVPVTTEQSVVVPLRYNTDNGNGWNMVGPPNARDYLWSDVQVVVFDPQTGEVAFSSRISDLTADNPYIDIRLWDWVDGAYDGTTSLMEEGCGYWVLAKQANVNLMFPGTFQGPALVGGLSPRMWLALGVDRAKKAVSKIFSPASAIADDGITPPYPMADFSGSTGGADSSADFCFISTLMGE
ncbi:MAG: right-handed parallel beta-helix repeat-containing protein, partial [Thermodesulfobacteriota bacterium]